MTWLDKFLAEHPEVALDSYEDRLRLAVHFTGAYPVDVLTATILASLTAVLRVARTESVVTSTADIHDLASKLTRNAVQTTIAIVLGTNPDRITKEDVEEARRAGAITVARVLLAAAEQRCDVLEDQLAAERADNALLRKRLDAVGAFAETHKAVAP